ncbi:thioredoxin family protein [Lutibacter sp. Hel_I_33_5]|uniref:thioredoxin family protein n=1 Tax=Lutibacter sp. Hel_I_33_5 TaxID=1566289 RepID=UPI0011A7F7C3
MSKHIQKSLDKTYTYQEYRDLVASLVTEGKSTGPNQSEALSNYSMLNDKRMKRLDKTIKLSENTISKAKKVDDKQTWIVLTESWCGDAAQTMPVINKIANENEHIEFKVALRDENLELMDEFLTNGGRSIPKLIVLDSGNNVVNSWGPRPAIATKMVADYKAEHGSLDPQFKQDLQVWYNKDKGKSTQEDFLSLLQ